ncbi:mitochondrial inner membrane protein OXA1L-like [Arapaima gigas]
MYGANQACFLDFEAPVEPTATALNTPAPATDPYPSSGPAGPVAEQGAEVVPTALDVLQGGGPELSLAELGLAGYTPVGLIQNILEFMHLDVGLPWWGAIVAGTVLARCAVFPVIVKGQREAAKLNNVLPEMTKLTNRMNEAKMSGNKFECQSTLLVFLISSSPWHF